MFLRSLTYSKDGRVNNQEGNTPESMYCKDLRWPIENGSSLDKLVNERSNQVRSTLMLVLTIGTFPCRPVEVRSSDFKEEEILR
nr:hypothetical protein [Tanacetum cinerariifolium]